MSTPEPATPPPTPPSSTDDAYAARLTRLGGRRWKRVLDVQAPYRWNLRSLEPGFTLDVGCGVGRNLAHLDGNGVGVDPNTAAVAEARRRGLDAFSPEEFAASPHAVEGRFDSLLLAHVLEHLEPGEAAALLATYVPYVRPGGKVIVITPQEAGQRSDATHVAFVDFARADDLVAAAGVRVERHRSFPFPRPVGRYFRHNEFVTVGRTADR